MSRDGNVSKGQPGAHIETDFGNFAPALPSVAHCLQTLLFLGRPRSVGPSLLLPC